MAWIPIALGVAVAGGAFAARAITKRVAMPAAQRVAEQGNKNVWGQVPYPGNFKEKMDMSEAALILGIRASSEKRKVEDRYRKLMMLNHPDQGGSPYLALKVNEAKQILEKGKINTDS